MALIGAEKISHSVLHVRGGGESTTVLEGGGDVWMVEPGQTNVRQIYNTVVEQLARQGYRIISVDTGTTTLQLELANAKDEAGATASYILVRAGVEGGSIAADNEVQFLASRGLPGLSQTQASSILAPLKTGQTIPAIKAIREAKPSLGLKEAKDLAENLQAALGVPLKSGGCLGVIVILAVGAPWLTTYLIHLRT